MNKGDLLISKDYYFQVVDGIVRDRTKADFCLIIETGSFSHTVMLFGSEITPLTITRHPDYISKHFVPHSLVLSASKNQ